MLYFRIPAGIGEPFFDSVESAIAHIIFAIPAIKGIEFGAGFKAARMKGSEHNDPIINSSGKTQTNHAGGINGGISNGNDIVFSSSKPTSSTPPTESFNMATNLMETFSIKVGMTYVLHCGFGHPGGSSSYCISRFSFNTELTFKAD
jgi:chorismate synthase